MNTATASLVKPESPPGADLARWMFEVLVVGAVFFAASRLVITFEGTTASPVWPPSGFALAAVLVCGYRVWPGIFAGAVLAEAVIIMADHSAGAPAILAVSLSTAAGCTLEAIVAGALLHRWIDMANPLERGRDVFKCFAAALLAGMVSAAIGPTSIALAGMMPWNLYPSAWVTWLLGDVTSMLVVAPVVLLWWRERRIGGNRRRGAELGIIFGLLVTASWIAFSGRFSGAGHTYVLSYVPLPFLLWAALRFGQRETATALLVVSSIAVMGTVRDPGGLSSATINLRLLLLQAYISVVAVTVLTTGAIVTERRRAEERVRKSERQLAESQQIARVGSWAWEIPRDRVTWSDELYRIFGLEPQSVAIDYRSAMQRMHPEDRELVERFIERSIKERVPYSLEHRIVLADGIERMVHGRGQVIFDAAGKPAWMLGTCQDITERKQGEQERAQLLAELGVANERLQAISHRLLVTQEDERRRLARELHDEIGQAVTAAQMNLRLLQRRADTAALAPHLEENIQMLAQVLQNVRDLSLDLRPSLLDDLGLVAALRWYTTQQAERAGLNAVVLADPLEERLDPTLETTCFRVTQEAVTNVIRHAQAKELMVEIRRNDGILHLRVRDDGVGFNVNAVRRPEVRGTSLGLLGMEERVSLAGGHLEFTSAPEQGTEIHAWFPVKLAAPAAS